MARTDAAIAVRRFGLGARPGDVQRIAADPRGYLLSALREPAAATLEGPELFPSYTVFTELRTAQIERKMEQEAQASAAKATAAKAAADGKGADIKPPGGAPASAQAMANAPAMPNAPAAPSGQSVKPGQIRREAYRDEASARLQRALTTDTPFLERLVMFWSGHFCVSASKGQVRALAGAFEREAIRPHVLGRFSDMLRAVEQHPAMLIYLDNVQSIGPGSRGGVRNGKGLNENLAREILELHTLGVAGGYSQADVTNLARLITGWTVGGLQQEQVDPGRFMFAPNRHEPGDITVLGNTYGGGVEAGERCLDDLAHHPATARHIATRLVRHFISSEPPVAVVSQVEKAFRDSGGDLKAVATALVTAPEAWSPEPRKVAPPYDFLVATARGLALQQLPAPELLRVMTALGQPLWEPPSPAGWPDADDAWMAPSSIRERLRVAERAARLVDKLSDPRAVAADVLGPALSDATRETIARAETREQGFELLVMSPEFLRR